jgi:Peptidase family M20/M25/M40
MLLAFKHKTPTNKRKPSLDAFAGRGSSDIKSRLAAMFHAAAAARDEGFLKAGRIGIVLVPDEETAGPRGGVIWNANRGAISLRATMRGKAAHVGRQYEG